MGFKENIIHGAKVFGRKVKAKSPTILVVAGVVGLVGAGIAACKQTSKELNKVLEEHKKDVQALKDIRDGKVVLNDITTEEYAATKYKKHLTHVYLRTVAKLAKVYAVPLLMAALSVTSILTGHGILNKWHLNAVAEVYAVRETLNDYRERVKGKIGDEAEKLLFLDAEKAIVTDKVTDENGEEKEESREALVGTGAGDHLYTYEVSEKTMKGFYHFNHPSSVETMLKHLLSSANNQMELHDMFFLADYMRHHWKDEYLAKHPEVFTDGWMRNNPLAAKQIDDVAPIVADLVRVSGPQEPVRYTITFNAQGNIVKAMAANKNKEKMAKKLGRKIQAVVK